MAADILCDLKCLYYVSKAIIQIRLPEKQYTYNNKKKIKCIIGKSTDSCKFRTLNYQNIMV